jgi:hypothetical protein
LVNGIRFEHYLAPLIQQRTQRENTERPAVASFMPVYSQSLRERKQFLVHGNEGVLLCWHAAIRGYTIAC